MAFEADGSLKAYDSFFDLDVNPVTLTAVRHSEDFATDESKWQQQRLQSLNILENANAPTPLNPTEAASTVTSSRAVMDMFSRWIPTAALIRHTILTALVVIIEQSPGLLSTMSMKL